MERISNQAKRGTKYEVIEQSAKKKCSLDPGSRGDHVRDKNSGFCFSMELVTSEMELRS